MTKPLLSEDEIIDGYLDAPLQVGVRPFEAWEAACKWAESRILAKLAEGAELPEAGVRCRNRRRPMDRSSEGHTAAGGRIVSKATLPTKAECTAIWRAIEDAKLMFREGKKADLMTQEQLEAEMQSLRAARQGLIKINKLRKEAGNV